MPQPPETHNRQGPPWTLALSNPSRPGSLQDFQACQEAPDLIRSLCQVKGTEPEEIVYACAAYTGIVERNPDLASILKGEGYSVYVLENSFMSMIHRTAEVNVHPRFADVEILKLGAE